MSKKRSIPYLKKLATIKVVEEINGPEGITRVYGGERACKKCHAPLSQYNPDEVCSLCQIQNFKKES